MTWSFEGREGSRTSGDREFSQEKEQNTEISRPARSRNPGLKDLETMRPIMGWMELMKRHRLKNT
ncbi:hypothetical protein F2P79_025996, partial [Pimephales promelas]